MTRTLAIAISLVIATFTVADEPKKSDAKPPAFAVEVETLKQGVEKKLQPIHAAVEKEYEAAKTDGDREAIRKKSHEKSAEVHTPAYEQAMKLLRPNAADPAAAVGLVWVSHAREAALQHEAVGLLRKHHLVRPETIELAKGMKQSGFGWVEGMLRAQLAAADLPQDQAWRVLLSLAMCLQGQANWPSQLADASESELQEFDHFFGKERVAEMKKYDQAKLEAEAIKLFTEVGEKYPKREIIPGLPVGDLARSSIFEIQNLSVGKVAPDITGEDLDGVKFKLSESRGKVVMLSFWASWCGPCMGLVPHERELVEQYEGKPFVLIGVNGDSEKKDLKKVIAENKITWRSFWAGEKGPEGPIPRSWNVNGWPTIYLIDETGVIRSKTAIGKTLDMKVATLVAEAEKTNGKK